MLSQLYASMEQGLLQGYQMIASPEIPQDLKSVEMKIMTGKIKLMEETMKMFGFNDTEEYLPYIGVMEAMTDMIDAVNRQKAAGMNQQMKGGNSGGGQAGAGVGGAVPPPEAGGIDPNVATGGAGNPLGASNIATADANFE
jgi:hypothetical protein